LRFHLRLVWSERIELFLGLQPRVGPVIAIVHWVHSAIVICTEFAQI